MPERRNDFPVHKHVRMQTALALGVKALALGEEETEHFIIRQALWEYLSNRAPDLAAACTAAYFYDQPMDAVDVEANIYIARRIRERDRVRHETRHD